MPEPKQAILPELFREIAIIDQLIRSRLEAHLPDGLIAAHFTVLSHLLARGDGATPIDIARAFEVPKTSMTHTIKGLQARGYVDVRPNPEDGRSKQVWLTDKGRRLSGQIFAVMQPQMAKLSAAQDMAALAETVPVLRALRIYLDANRIKRSD